MKSTPKTETEMRDEESPHPKTIEQLQSYISSLVDREHDYGTSAYAMSLAATAAFKFVASKLGCTGFQASCADMDFLRRSRMIKGPFMIVRMEDALFPQCDPVEKLRKALDESADWFQKEARAKLADVKEEHPDVIRHWVKLANLNGEAKPYLELADFMESRRGWTDKFVEEHASEFKKFGIKDVYLYEDGDVAKAEKATDGGGHRIDMPVSITFERRIEGIKVSWSVDTEMDGSNGASGYRFDFPLLERLSVEAPAGAVKHFILAYTERARKATAQSIQRSGAVISTDAETPSPKAKGR